MSDEVNLLRDLIQYMQNDLQDEIKFIRHDMSEMKKDVDILNRWKWKLSGITLALVTVTQIGMFFYNREGKDAVDTITHERSERQEHKRNDRSGPRSEAGGRSSLSKPA